VMCFLVPGI